MAGSHGAGEAHQLTPAGACRGPTGTLLNELAEASHEPANCEVIFVRAPLAQFCTALERTLCEHKSGEAQSRATACATAQPGERAARTLPGERAVCRPLAALHNWRR